MSLLAYLCDRGRREGALASGHYTIGAADDFDIADIVAGVGTPIWSEKTTFPWDITPSVLSIVSTSAEDASGGTGAYNVLVNGIDVDGYDQSEIVQMNGLTPVTTVKTYKRLNRIQAAEVGGTCCNVGDITVQISGNIAARMVALQGRDFRGVFTIPMSWPNGVFTRIWANISDAQAAAATIALRIRDRQGLAWQRIGILGVNTNGGVHNFVLETPALVSPGADLEVVVTALDRNAVALTAGFDIVRTG